MSLSSVKIGSAFKKRYAHNLDFDNNTTMDFGTVQPLLCQYLLPDSDVNLNYRQLVRLAPMPTPSFARIFAKNYARFVPVSDVVPYHEALLSHKPYFAGNKSFVPAFMPFTENRVLMYMLLKRAQWSAWLKGNDSSQYKIFSRGSNESPEFNTLMQSFYSYLGLGSQPPASLALSQLSYVQGAFAVSFEESDYIVPVYNSASASIQPDGFLTFRFSDSAKRVRKQLVGLGYGLALDDSNNVSLAPILAYYKAYFDTFGLTRVRAFESTACYSLIRLITNYAYDYGMKFYSAAAPSVAPVNNQEIFTSFIYGLADLCYTSPDNYLAAHRTEPMNGAVLPFGGSSFMEANGTDINSIGNVDAISHLPYLTQENFSASSSKNTLLTQLSLDVLKRVSRFVSKDSAIGYRISDWVKAHYGADVVNTLFEESYFVHTSTTPVDISDVFSTSDTADIATADKGEYLGAYAGKGIGFNKNAFKFHAKTHGFLFVFSCIVPQVRDFVGTDPTLYAVDMDKIPVPEFDALGFELTPRAAVVGDNFIASRNEFHDKAFGFIPRYSGFKVKKDVVNGDMYLGYFKRDLQPYFLDRIPYNNYLYNFNKDGTSSYHMSLRSQLTPNASTAWQQLNGNTAVGNYNRLFYDEGKPFEQYGNTDNFIVQTVFDFKVTNFLKPISDSYQTFDESADTSSTNVKAN